MFYHIKGFFVGIGQFSKLHSSHVDEEHKAIRLLFLSHVEMVYEGKYTNLQFHIS